MNNWEFTNSVSEYRKVDKLSSMVEKYGESPEQILIKKEERMVLLHFVCWLKGYLQTISDKAWDIWRDNVIYGMNYKQCAKKYKIGIPTIGGYKRRCDKHIKQVLPLYYEQFGDLENYLKG